MRKNNRKRSLIGAFLMLLILISGTFAFYQFNQGAFNPVRIEQRMMGRLHDDFEYQGPVQSSGAMDKDVFAENFTTDDLMVRVRFREFLELYTNQGEEGAITFGEDVDFNDHTTWPIALFDLVEIDDEYTFIRRPDTVTEEIGYLGFEYLVYDEDTSEMVPSPYMQIGWTLGNPADVQKIFMPTHNHVYRTGAAINPEFAGTFAPALADTPFGMTDLPALARFSSTTGAAGEAIAGNGEFLSDASVDVRDMLAIGVQTGPSVSDGTHAFWSLTPGVVDGVERSYYYAYLFIIDSSVNPHLVTLYTDDDGEPVQVRHEAQPTLVALDDSYWEGLHNGIMTIEAWNDQDQPRGNFWIMDADGSFFWNGYLYGTDTRIGHYNDAGIFVDGICADAGIPDQGEEFCLPTVATSLLLNGINIPDHPDLSYVIHVDAEWFIADTFTGLSPRPSDAIWYGFYNANHISITTPPPGDDNGDDDNGPALPAIEITAVQDGNEITVTVVNGGPEFEIEFFFNDDIVPEINAGGVGIEGPRDGMSGVAMTFAPNMFFDMLATQIEIRVTVGSTVEVFPWAP